MKFSNMPYERVDLESFSNDWNNLVKHFEAAKSGSEQFKIHRMLTELIKKYHTMRSLAYIRHSLNTNDEFYSKEQDYYDENGPKFVKLVMDYYKKLVASPWLELMELMSVGHFLYHMFAGTYQSVF